MLHFRRGQRWQDRLGTHWHIPIEHNHAPLGYITGNGNTTSGMRYSVYLHDTCLGTFPTVREAKEAVRRHAGVRPAARPPS